jgi:hypothetical protein
MVGTYLCEKCVGRKNVSCVGRFDRSLDRHKGKNSLMSVGTRPTHFNFNNFSGMIGRYKATRPTVKDVGRKTTDIFFLKLCPPLPICIPISFCSVESGKYLTAANDPSVAVIKPMYVRIPILGAATAQL